MEGNTKSAILVFTYERWHTTTYIGVGGNYIQTMDSILKIVYQNGEFISSESSIFGISLDTIFTVITTISIFIVGYIVNRKIEEKKETKRLKELEEYFETLIHLMESPVRKQVKALIRFSKILKEEKEQHYNFEDVSIYVLDQIHEIDNKDLYSIYLKRKAGSVPAKTKLFEVLRTKIAHIENIRNSLKDSFTLLDGLYQKYQDTYNTHLKVTSDAYDNMRSQNEQNNINPANDPFFHALDNIRGQWAALEQEGIEFQDRYIAKEHYIDPVRTLCTQSVADPRAVFVLKHIMECLYAYNNIEEMRSVYRRHFLLDARGLQKGLIEIQNTLEGFRKL